MNQKQLLEESAKRINSHIQEINTNPKTLDERFMRLLQEQHISLVPKTIGNYIIDVDVVLPGKELTVVSMRNWLMMGYKPLKVTYETPVIIYQLKKEGHGLLMSSSPQEMFLQYEAYKAAKGRVLVGGLGIGLYASMIATKPEVTEVIVIEIEKDIIKLVKPNNPKIKVINDDIWNYLKTTKEKFDYIYIDIHYGTGEYEYKDTVLPMRKILKEKFPETPASFWGEEEMKTQYEKRI